MKTILKFTVATALMFGTVSGMAMDSKKLTSVPGSDTELEILETADKGKPVLTKRGDKVYLNMLNLQGEKIEIKVFDSSRRLLFNEVIKDDLTVEKAFNFENAYEDSYIVVVRDREGTYSEEITVK